MKSARHAMILDIINEYPIETQDELISLLEDRGFYATQATISRDMKDLRLFKALGNDGKYRYVCASGGSKDLSANVTTLFSSSVNSLDLAENIVVVKTISGMAQAVCAALDTINYSSVVGTIAGDDTIFIACRSGKSAQNIIEELRKLSRQG